MYGEGESRGIWSRDADAAKHVPFVFRNLKIIELRSIFEDGRVVAKKVDNVKSGTLTGLVKQYIDPKSILYTDDLASYNRVYREGYTGERIMHSSGEYVRYPDIHTNNIEGFWSLVKGGIGGVYRHVSPKYVESYVNEYAYRYSHRNDDTPMFHLFLGRLATVILR